MRQFIPDCVAAPSRLFSRWALWKRLFLTMLLLPPVLAGGTSGAYYLRLHRVSRALELTGLPLAPAPNAAQRILVLSPHCDDETLALGGRITDARRAGAEVTVAFLTNGDGFPIAAGRELGEVRLSPDDYIRFAERRQAESVAALGELGVSPQQIVFLGYPDRGIAPLWGRHWKATNPYRSRYTGCTRSPYARAYTPHAVHCGTSLLADIERLLKTTRPTDIYVTHPADDHPDHAAAAAFAQAALLGARDRGEAWARAARLGYYLVHRGNWPLPQGMHPEKPLLPPAGLVALDTRWEVYPLSPAARDAKERALGRYGSQMAVMRRFLISFVRENELYGTMPELSATGQTAPAAPDAVRDDVVRYARPSADLRGLSVREGTDTLQVRVKTEAPVSANVRYTLLLRAEGGADRFLALDLPVKQRGAASDPVAVRASGNVLEATVPLRLLQGSGEEAPRRVWVAAQTHWARVPVDHTGYRPFTLAQPPDDAPRAN